MNAPATRLAPVTVTIELLDGDTGTGRLARPFVPAAPDVVLDVAGEAGAPSLRTVFAAERVACVCFHVGGHAPAITTGITRLRVHLARGRAFLVTARAADVHHRVGFYGTSAEPGGPFSEVFFYAHGVNARELDVMRIGDLLVQAGAATRADVEAALAVQSQHGGKRLGELLVEMKLVSEIDLAVTLARKFNLPFVDLDECLINEGATQDVVPASVVHRFRILPIDDDGETLTIAVADPLATEVVEVLRARAGRRVIEVVATPSQIAVYVARWCAEGGDERATRDAPLDLETLLRDVRADRLQLIADDQEQDAS